MSTKTSNRFLRRTGFTLIELLIVMGIIAALVSIALPAVMKAREAQNKIVCANNLRQMGAACLSFHNQFGYFPTAGTVDYAAPFYPTTAAGTPGAPAVGYKQDAGWAFQILPLLDQELVWDGGSAPFSGKTQAASDRMIAVVKNPFKSFICPSRRNLALHTYANANYPAQTAYSALLGKSFSVTPLDYAGCNGNGPPVGTPAVPVNNGMIRSQLLSPNLAATSASFGNPVRAVVRQSDVTDGLTYTLLIGEKAASPSRGTIANEDDMGFGAAFSQVNFNAVRFTSASLLPLRDVDVSITLGTGGAFGSIHSGTWNALMADGSVQQITYSIDPTIFAAIGTIAGGEPVTDLDLN